MVDGRAGPIDAARQPQSCAPRRQEGARSAAPPLTMPRPNRATAPDLELLFEAGRYDEVVAEAGRSTSGRAGAYEAQVVAVRAELRLGKVGDALRRLEPLTAQRPRDAVAAALHGIALVRAGADDRGHARLRDALAMGETPAQRSEAAYWLAWAAFRARELSDAERWVRVALEQGSGIDHARALGMSGWIDEARDDHVAAARTFRLALAALRSSERRDDGFAVSLLRVLAILSAELVDDELGEPVRRELPRFAWPAWAVEDRFQTVLFLALGRLNHGDVAGALGGIDDAVAAAAGSAILLGDAGIEEADVHRAVGEPVAALRLFQRIEPLLRTVPWPSTTIEDQMVLLDCVALAARLGTPSVQEWLARYSVAGKDDEGSFSLTKSARVRAIELHARGLAEASVSDRDRGAKRVAEALAVWDAIGYRRRAVYAAADLVALGRPPSEGTLRRIAAYAPAHPLARLLSAGTPARRTNATRATHRIDVSPAERRVIDALLAGESVREMAQRWGRSEFTIRNHLKRLFAKYDVRSTAALVAKVVATKDETPRDSR